MENSFKKRFKESWEGRCGDIKENQFSREQCKHIHQQFINEFYSLVMSFGPNEFTWAIDNKYTSLESEVLLALEEANSNFRMNYEPWYERIFKKIKMTFNLI